MERQTHMAHPESGPTARWAPGSAGWQRRLQSVDGEAVTCIHQGEGIPNRQLLGPPPSRTEPANGKRAM